MCLLAMLLFARNVELAEARNHHQHYTYVRKLAHSLFNQPTCMHVVVNVRWRPRCQTNERTFGGRICTVPCCRARQRRRSTSGPCSKRGDGTCWCGETVFAPAQHPRRPQQRGTEQRNARPYDRARARKHTHENAHTPDTDIDTDTDTYTRTQTHTHAPTHAHMRACTHTTTDIHVRAEKPSAKFVEEGEGHVAVFEPAAVHKFPVRG